MTIYQTVKAVSHGLYIYAGVLRAGSVAAQPPLLCGRLVRQSEQESKQVETVSDGEAVTSRESES